MFFNALRPAISFSIPLISLKILSCFGQGGSIEVSSLVCVFREVGEILDSGVCNDVGGIAAGWVEGEGGEIFGFFAGGFFAKNAENVDCDFFLFLPSSSIRFCNFSGLSLSSFHSNEIECSQDFLESRGCAAAYAFAKSKCSFV